MHYEKHLIQNKLKGENQNKVSLDKKVPQPYEMFPRGYIMQDYRMMNNQYMPGMFQHQSYFDDKKVNK